MNKNYYITTPIYYPSAKPHMGHAYSSIIADFFARIKRILGYNVFFLTGTDEHGQKIQRAAEKLNKDPKTFCDEIENGTILNAKGEKFNEMILVGIGGSDLGPKMVVDALQPYQTNNLKVHFVSNMSRKSNGLGKSGSIPQ